MRIVCRIRGLMALPAAVLLAAAAGLSPTVAEPYPVPQPPDPSYVFTEIGEVFSGTVLDALTPGQLEYFVKAGILTNAGHLARPFVELTEPQTWRTPQGAAPALAAAQKLWDALTHTPPFDLGFPPHPAYAPDWNQNGRFGIADIDDAMHDDDYDDPQYATARFRLPCNNSDGSVWYETTEGACASSDSGAVFRLGTVRKFRMVDARGISLAGKAYFPDGVDPDRPGPEKYPVTVGFPGAGETQNDVAMYAQGAARNGFISFTFGQAGQPASDGNALDLLTPLLAVEKCFAPGSCLDAQDVVRWVAGQDIVPISDLNNEIGNVVRLQNPRLVRINPAYVPAGQNMRDPWLDLLDLDHINLWGQSIGSVGMSSYLNWQDKGHGYDGRPLPRVDSYVGMSGFTQFPSSAAVQLQTADFDLPGFHAYGFFPPNPFFQPTDGPIGTKDLYDLIRRDPRSTNPVMFIDYEGGSHGDSINWLGVPRNVKSPALSVHYAMAWFNCHGRADRDQTACDELSQPFDGLSRAVATEYAPQGNAGPSRCVTIPDRATLEQVLRPQIFLQNTTGAAWYDCVPRS
ncbi:hypothetical protein [Nocardia arthritidis]|uniref:Uncharacterized protein n=1 Tax=Nocardia arthritidis TaxID=228602 RepID=A0A6G9YLP2_9NOCA|nr:hypothetical protein [Nocardia arthritidis]QIS14101.1 hypothetical protein F5544_31295 [Nocardia arthritidis]